MEKGEKHIVGGIIRAAALFLRTPGYNIMTD